MKVAPGVEMLELSAMLMDGPGTLYPTLLWDSQDVVLVDAGLPGMAQQFREAMKQARVPFEKLTRIIITHHDIDHIGSLEELQRTSPRPVEVLAHSEEVVYIQGERPPIKMTPEMLKQMEERMKDLPADRRKAMRANMKAVRKQKLKVDRTIGDGEMLACGGGIQIIHTPGHTPGHVCLYHPVTKTLIAGDALFVEKENLVPAPPFINADTPMALASLKKLSRCDIANVIAYHGGLFQNNPNGRLAQILHDVEIGAK
jgi:glyoxylase-like metal-dependent hydrolase (beta-lactamase superfamily II)